jgi:uncharacterized protein YfaS (alpha-2-macroglobulin family)
MKVRLLSMLTSALLIQLAASGPAQQQVRVESFSPQGTVKQVRQVRARFSEPMVALGDISAVQPFEVTSPEGGAGRWVDERNWTYNFDHDLPAGVRCEFRVRQGLRSAAGRDVAGQQRFTFSTGGPAIVTSSPSEGTEAVDEDQIFVVEVDGPPVEASVLQHAAFAIDGIANRVGVRIVTGKEKEDILKAEYPAGNLPKHLLLLQARQNFPAGARISLIWGKGIASSGGVATDQDQILQFTTRPAFEAQFNCSRENAEAQCLPITSMEVFFTAPIRWADAARVTLTGSEGKKWLQQQESPRVDEFVSSVHFKGPFPELSSFTIGLPPGMKDDAGRALTNAGKFPLVVKTDAYPPLAKFAADFGILELKTNPPLLPVTLRNVEPNVAGRIMSVAEGQENVDPPRALVISEDDKVQSKMQGKVYQVPVNTANEMLYWIKKIKSRTEEDRGKSVFGPVTAARAKSFAVPKPGGAKAFEVVGIPLPAPGFYVVELESELLGAALLGDPKPMYVPTTVLVTNLAIHFKWGDESSLVWVTALDSAKPVPQASVEIRNCEGKLEWEGKTDRDGIARIGGLPRGRAVPQCSYNALDSGLVISARAGNDLAFVHSSWDEGIEPWRFQVPVEFAPEFEVAHTIFDRSLFRPGETVHMKHIRRRESLAGFAPVPESELGGTLQIVHQGSNQKYDLHLQWRQDGSAESTWTIPREALLGTYSVRIGRPNAREGAGVLTSGIFRVENYRVPLMKAVLRPPSDDQVAPSSIAVDTTVQFLSGGAAGNLPVKLRYQLEPKHVSAPEAFDSFEFSKGKVREGLVRGGEDEAAGGYPVQSMDLTLDRSGSTRAVISGLPKLDRPMGILAELDFKDPNGEVQTASSRISLWPAARIIGIRPEGWTLSRQAVKFQVAVADLAGKPVAGAPVAVDLLERKTYSHRTRLVGGFYAFEHSREITKVSTLCTGKTDPRGLLLCEQAVTQSGNLILQAVTSDPAGREAATFQDVWVAGENDWWFPAQDSDRMDVIPEAKNYEPGQKARFQVRMPFRKATALVTVEREGIAEAFVKELSGKEPVIEVPVRGSWSPNMFISVLAIRGRAGDVQPTAMVDLGRPAFRLGIAEIRVGWRAHELKVRVTPGRPVYKVREKAQVRIAVATADGQPLPQGSEVAVAAVDEGLLELMPNESWKLLDKLMGRRGYSIRTATAQMNVIGKRHFGLKALPQGGGGGKSLTRELFDTLLLWQGRVALDRRGEASVEIPLNDSLTSFRVVAVATGGVDRFGTGDASFRTTQDLMIFSGIPPLVRQGDKFVSTFTVRNATERPMQVHVAARIDPPAGTAGAQDIAVGAGESREIRWNLTAPAGVDALKYEIEAAGAAGAADKLTVAQKVLPAIPVRTLQATLTPVDKSVRIDVERPPEALPDVGGIRVSLQPRLVEGLSGVTDYMRAYPYTCLEQSISKAIALRDGELWKRAMELLPVYLDSDGLAKYFPSMNQGTDTLTAYVVSIAHEAGWQIPSGPKQRMLSALEGFAQGRIVRNGDLPTADLTIRKLSAIEALSRERQARPEVVSSLSIAPNLWPTSAVLDWLNVLQRMPGLKDRAARLTEAQQILRARLNFQGTTMGFSTDRTDLLWWLMVSPDANAVRLLLSALNSADWQPDIPRLIRGALARQRRGHWDTTVANAWGLLALEKYSKTFESVAVTGESSASLAGRTQSINWQTTPKGAVFSFAWPQGRGALDLTVEGTGQPWATVQSLAAIPLREPLASGFRIVKTMTPIEQRTKGAWNVGDIVRIKLEIESQSEMTWVVVNDPVPAGAAIFGSGLGRDSTLSLQGQRNAGWAWPAFEERSFESFRAYYRYAPKGTWSLEYTLRLNNGGVFQLPPTRVEAMYAPDMFGEFPNGPLQVN